MKKTCFKLLAVMAGLVFPGMMNASVGITKSGGWFESAYVEWTKEAGYAYNVYVSPAASEAWTKLDNELVREYPTFGRADALGLAAGSYKLKVVPVQDNVEVAADAAETGALSVVNYDRAGFAHFKSANSSFNPANGVGAYKNDGTLKDGAKVFYVTADNAATITTDVVTNNKGGTTKGVGLQDIITLYQKGQDKTPICFRIVGTVKKENLDRIDSSAEGLQIKGRNADSELNMTIEGVGFDATVHGFGFLIRNACSLELRNFASMWSMDDAVSMDTDNSNIWVHNLDLFYGKPGSASDQKKGDGTIDVKSDSKYITIAYNHLWDSGKSSLCGMTSESGPNWITYHHNWFDHSDSRHPRIRTMSVHVYNNYYDGNSKYGVGAAKSSNAFVENNYFRNCKYPMLTSKQGSDVNNGQGSSDQTKGTFSGEDGGVIKAYGNYMTGQKGFQKWTASGTNNTHFDAYVAASRDEQVPSSVKALQGGRTYDNFDTDPSLMYTGYKCDAATDVPAIVKGDLGAGRCGHGDFSWTFGSNEDTNDAVISSLSTAIQNYKSMLVGFFGKAVSNGGAQEGDNSGGSNEGTDTPDSPIVDDGGDNTVIEETFMTGELNGKTIDDYYWFSPENEAQVNAWLADGTITLVDGTVEGSEKSSFMPDYSYDAVAAGKTFASTEYTGSLNLAKASAAGKTDGGAVIFKCPKGVTSFEVYFYRTGSQYLNVYTSTNGTAWTKVANVDKGASGIMEKNFSSAVFDKDHCLFVKIENTSTGGLNVQGVRICNEKDATAKDPSEPTDPTDPTDPSDPTPGDNPGGDVDANALYVYTIKGIVPAAEKEGVVQNYSEPIATQGGFFVFGNVSKIEASTIAASGYAMKLDGDAKEGNTKYAKVILDNALKAGDKISLSCYATSTPKNDYGLSIYTEDQTKLLASVYSTKKNAEETLTLDVTADMVGMTTFCICRNAAKSAYLTAVNVTGDAPSAIKSVDAKQTADGQCYDLLGRPVSAPQKGVYISGGKKVVVK